MKYKALVFISKRFLKKKNLENVGRNTMFSFADYLSGVSAYELNNLFSTSSVYGEGKQTADVLPEANRMTEVDISSKYSECVDEIIENRINGAKLNSDGFYDAPVPDDDGTSFNMYRNEEQKKRMITIVSILALLALVIMIIVIVLVSKYNTFY